MTRTRTATLSHDAWHHDGRELCLDVEYAFSIEHDPGCRMTPNGDGWPESTEVNIDSAVVRKATVNHVGDWHQEEAVTETMQITFASWLTDNLDAVFEMLLDAAGDSDAKTYLHGD